MKKITLICGNGYSSSMLVNEMEKVAKYKCIEVIIRAISESRFEEYENDTDILLIGPQLGYVVDDLREKYKKTKIKISVINGTDYGMLNGSKVLDDELKL